ncbi:MAG: DNA mismatch repair endonuclease MutL [Bacteroides sp.]|nr:DNA mismatch repair endonuclease MutL [Bacteroides sp.]MCM1086217.1 DNA mismatch repair endonuclease MutL [Bacteroides sp.]
MESVINILPEFVANQIAAGEVVNRPASAVKELLENAVDAGSSKIELHLTDGGRTLIQVADNGCGMNAEDAERCFMPHATSKLAKADDLHHIRTMGFRGEALASIAAVAQVELQTRREEDETGTRVCIEGNKVTQKESCACAQGTNICVRNLYFNTPARRQFLKSDEVEYRYAEEEFNRIALAQPGICFQLYRNEQKINHLEASNLNRRIVQLFGKAFENRLVKIAQEVPGLKVAGYICTPDYSVKGRGKQYLFVNRRIIRHGGISNLIERAYQGLLPEGKSPAFFIHLEMEPEEIDVNIHPTKTEIRFKNQDFIYKVLFAAVKYALGVNQVSDSIDFGSEQALPYRYRPQGYVPEAPKVRLNPDYNPFTNPAPATDPTPDYREAYARNFALMQENMQVASAPVQMLLDCVDEVQADTRIETPGEPTPPATAERVRIFQLFDSYIVTPLKSGLALIDQQAASERVIYNSYSEPENGNIPSQRTLFPQTVELSASDAQTVKEIKDELGTLGWAVEWIGGNSFMVNAMPQGVEESRTRQILEEIASACAGRSLQTEAEKRQSIALAAAKELAIKKGTPLSQEEILYLTTQLFSGPAPELSPSGKRVIRILDKAAVEGLFGRAASPKNQTENV